ncbi:MAG TPA: nucleotidyltransferase family protein [Thermodesulfobacteriota bacterium]|nr:nucleotidyltransferase family protein [Thermodesulfobacteriota bacterium]
MVKGKDYGGCWPTPAQELLLRASLLKGDGAVSAFSEWKAAADINTVDPGSYRLFPLLYSNLKSNGIDDPLMNIFGWVYKKTVSNNRTLYGRLSGLLAELNARGMPAILHKGSALALLYYSDPGLRPMMDADILVPTGRVREAIDIITGLGWRSSLTPLKGFSDKELLSKLGWTPAERSVRDYTDEYFSVRHGQDFTNPAQFTIDLHWHLLHGYNRPDSDALFWKRARGISVEGVDALALDPTDQLLQVCSHGVAWNTIPPIRWVADASAIVRKVSVEGEGIDWERLINVSLRHGKVLPVGEALGYLNRYLDRPLPDGVFRRLGSAPVSKTGRFEYRVRTRPPGVLDGLVELRFLWSSYSSENSGKNLFVKLYRFPKFLQHVFGMESAWHLVLYSGFELVRRTGKFIGSVRERIFGKRPS